MSPEEIQQHDAARDELADAIDAALEERMERPDSVQSWDADEDLYPLAEALLARGYRRSVSTEELETAAQKLHDEFSPFTTVGSLRAMKALARELGLEVT